MDIIRERHSVRQYQLKKIEEQKREILREAVKECNAESGMNIQILFDEPECFNGMMV